MTSTTWSGSTRWQAGVLSFTGALGSAHAHAHAAVQILTVERGTVVLTDAAGHARAVVRAVIPAGAVHTVETGPDAYGTTVYLDADHTAAPGAAGSGGADPRHVDTWTALSVPEPGAPGRKVLHPGLAAVLAMSPGMGGPGSLTEAARTVGLSPGRLGRLFTDQLGLPYTAWRRWARLKHAAELARAGVTLTEAAHGAGFTDSAHLTRVVHALFGLTPTQALAAARWSTDPHDERDAHRDSCVQGTGPPPHAR